MDPLRNCQKCASHELMQFTVINSFMNVHGIELFPAYESHRIVPAIAGQTILTWM